MSSDEVPHADHARDLSDRVKSYLSQTTHDAQTIDDNIALARKVLALSSADVTGRIDACLLLGSVLALRYDQGHDVFVLEEAIHIKRTALALCETGHPARVWCCVGLAVLIVKSYEREGDLRLLKEAIAFQRQTVDLRPIGHPLHSSSSLNLAHLLNEWYKRTGDVPAQDEVINLKREALAHHHGSPADRAGSCGDLARSLWTRYEQAGNVSLLEEAIYLQREALVLHPQGHADRIRSCGNLAVLLKTLYERTGDLDVLDQAISLQREGLELCPAGHVQRAASCGNLAASLVIQYQKTSDDHLLDEAIGLEREALNLRPPEHQHRSLSCETLALLLRTRHEYTGDVVLLDEAVKLERELLTLRPPGHPDRSSSCRSMAGSLMTHYGLTGELHFLDEAIVLEREALVLCPEGHPKRSLSLNTVALSLRVRYRRTGDVRLLDEAIGIERQALALCPVGHPHHSSSCGTLATSLGLRYKITGDVHLLEEAIDLQRRALDLCPQGYTLRPPSCENLAVSLRTLYECTGDARLLNEAIHLQQEALRLCPANDPGRSGAYGNLADSLIACCERTGEGSYFRDIIALEQAAVTIARKHTVWKHLCNLAWVHLQPRGGFYDVSKALSYLSQALESEPDDIRVFVRILRNRIDDVWKCDVERYHFEMIHIYQGLVNLLPLVAHPALDLQPQLRALSDSSRLGPDAFVKAALAGNSPAGLETLELAQSVIWSQTLHRRDPQLEDVPEPLADRLQQVLVVIATESTGDDEATALTSRDRLHVKSSQLYSLVQEIRALPGLHRFMQGETFETMRTAAFHHPVVVLVGARGHYYALIIASSLMDGHELLALDINDEDVKNASFNTQVARSSRSADAPEKLHSSTERLSLGKGALKRSEPLNRYSRILWHKIVKPVLDRLGFEPLHSQTRPRLHWCPTGVMSSLPLHAAGIYDGTDRRACADYVVSSYTPTVSSLLRTQRAFIPLRREHLSVALIAEKRAQDATLLTIHGVDEEIANVAAVTQSSNVQNIHQQVGSTTVTGTSAMMQAANIAHLACHGIQDIGDATQSGFCLGDGRLTIAKLMELKLDEAFLAFLSACETAKGDKEQPDQAMHLAATMLFSGFQSVIATMRAISDVDGPKIAKWFYEELLAKEVVDVDSVAYALDFAVGKLRDSGITLDRWVPFIHMGA